MKMRILPACLACIMIGFAVYGLLQTQTSGQDKATHPARTKWEYRMALQPSEDQLNELGRHGWELVSAVSKGPGDHNSMCYLKRAAQ